MPPRRKTPAKKVNTVTVEADAATVIETESQETAEEEEDIIDLVSDDKDDDEQSLEQIEAAISNVLDDDTTDPDNVMDTNEADETLKDDSQSTDNDKKSAQTGESADQVMTEAASTDDKKPIRKRADFSVRKDDIKDFQNGVKLCLNQRRIAVFPVTWKQLTTIPEVGDILTQKTIRYLFNVYDSSQGTGLLEMVFDTYEVALEAESILLALKNDAENTFTVQRNKSGFLKYQSIDAIEAAFPQYTRPGKQDYLLPDFAKKVAYVFNLPESCNEDRLKEQFPEAVNIWLPRDPCGSSKCEAYLELKDEADKNKFIVKYEKKTAIDDKMIPVLHLKLPGDSQSFVVKGKKAYKRESSYTHSDSHKRPRSTSGQGGYQSGRFSDRSQGGGYSRGGTNQGRFGGRDGGRRGSSGRQNQRFDNYGNDGYSQSGGYQSNYAQRPQPQMGAQPMMGSMQTQDALSLLVGLSQLVGNKSATQSGGGGLNRQDYNRSGQRY